MNNGHILFYKTELEMHDCGGVCVAGVGYAWPGTEVMKHGRGDASCMAVGHE